ncbi:hypothetical protein E4U55_000760 [Claviceps digitariae]|nr:hypothetical protein E4U55_000760 [Claviceps digitariae]
MLGYSSYNHQLVSRRMMKSPQAAMNLLHDLSTNLSPLFDSELKALRDLRADGGAIHFWDFSTTMTKCFTSIVELLDISDDEVWHEDVNVFTVRDLVDESLVGHLYMDLYPRESKYNHAADFSVRPVSGKTGKYVASGTALICNVTPPTKDTPALLEHSDVMTIFHELGHEMHDLMGRMIYAKYYGWRGRRDFGETPSQLL